MGEVYKARDTRLGREVAVKVAAEQFSERFEREARAISALNHPHICTLYDVGPNYLVMEFVQGAALRGPMPMEEALTAARQIAEALEAAHEKGITHRDLKPANIKITPDGTMKVLDFGLAKVDSQEDFEDSPTLSLAATTEGVILGTAAYMSPEQARGMPVNKRTDIWAFGVVLFEMLTGKRLFTGQSTTDILAAVVRANPDFSALPADTPAPIRRLLKRCLEKDRKKRLPDIGVARLEIDEALASPHDNAAIPTMKRQRIAPWLVAYLAVFALAVVFWYSFRPQQEIQWTGTRLGGPAVAFGPRISPDGQLLAFLAMVDGLTQVAVMKPETGNWAILTQDRSRGQINNVSWSRDGSRLYFDRWRGVFSVPVLGGGEQLVLEDAANPEVLPDGSLVVQRLNSDRRNQLHRYWPESGRVEPLNAVLPSLGIVRATRAGDRIVFFGKPLDETQAPDHLYAIELKSEKLSRLAPNMSLIMSEPTLNRAERRMAVGARRALMRVTRVIIVSVPLDGATSCDVDDSDKQRLVHRCRPADGSLFLDQWDRPTEVLRVSPEGGDPEPMGTLPPYPDFPGSKALPLPDGRVLVNSRTGGRDRLLLLNPGKDIDSLRRDAGRNGNAVGDCRANACRIHHGLKGRPNHRDGVVRRPPHHKRLEAPKGAAIDSMVASPDGQTIYYTASGSVWKIAAEDGQPEEIGKWRLRDSRSLSQELIVRLTEKGGHASRASAHCWEARKGRSRWKGRSGVASLPFYPNAVGKDGRILATLASPASWFWPVGLIDPKTGRVQVIRLSYYADMSGNWGSDGKLVIVAKALRVSVWRFRPEAKN